MIDTFVHRYAQLRKNSADSAVADPNTNSMARSTSVALDNDLGKNLEMLV
jgi:hypothetical protein